jgi:hypothetical protein
VRLIVPHGYNKPSIVMNLRHQDYGPTVREEINGTAPASQPIAVTNESFIRTFFHLSVVAHLNARSKGFWDSRDKVVDACRAAGGVALEGVAMKMIDGQQIALMHSELSEALEGSRKNLQDDHLPEFSMMEAELADVVIRIMDHAGAFSLRVGEAIVAKMAYNAGREPMHGGKLF